MAATKPKRFKIDLPKAKLKGQSVPATPKIKGEPAILKPKRKKKK